MAVYEESKTNLLNSLTKVSEQIKFVFETKNRIGQYEVGQGVFLTSTDEKQLNEHLSVYRKYADKLNKNSFEIAIVGLEKAGKSTFINALIENDLLPSAPARCTYTTTKLVSSNGKEDSAEIEFYSEEEFNQIFVSLFSEAFPEYKEPVNFKTITETEVTKLDDERESIDASIISDIKEIIKYRDSLILTAERKYFSQDELNTDEFKNYIRGEKITNSENVNTAKPRSVKSIEIRSSKVANFKVLDSQISPIFYDVPGFDSPTKIHRQQTVERLSKADAIILVTNVGRNPSLQGTILDVLKEIDSDNIPYKDKLFAFGNQLDTANSREIADDNERTFRNSLLGMAEDKRIFVGSALKHLTEKGLTNETGHKTFDFMANIEEFRAELIHYLQTERFAILEKNVKLYIKKGKELLEQIKNKLDKEVRDSDTDPENFKFDIVEQYQERIINAFNENLEKLKNTYREGQEHKELTKKLIQKIESNQCFTHISYDELRESNGGASITGITDKRAVNSRAREAKLQKILASFTLSVREFDLSNSEKVYNDIVNAFVESTLLSKADQNLVRGKIVDLFETRLKELLDIQSGKFEFLISRLSRPLFNIFKFPLANEETSSRLSQFESTRKDFIYLSTFYGDAELSKQNDTALTYLLLAQKESTRIDISIDRIIGILKDLIDEQTHIDKLKKATNAVADATTDVFNRLKKWRPFGEEDSESQEIQEPERIKEIKSSSGMTWFDFLFRPDRIGKIIEPTIIKLAEVSDTEEAVFKEINTDIDNIEKIFLNAVIPAINLEITSYIHNELQLNKLLEYVNKKHLNSFIRKEIVPVSAAKQIKDIDDEIEIIKLKQALVERLD